MAMFWSKMAKLWSKMIWSGSREAKSGPRLVASGGQKLPCQVLTWLSWGPIGQLGPHTIKMGLIKTKLELKETVLRPKKSE